MAGLEDKEKSRLKSAFDRIAGGETSFLAPHPEIQFDVLEADDVKRAFHSTVEEGYLRLHRTWPGLFATGVVGGIDVATGVFAIMLVDTLTGNELLAGLAFSIGFIALILAKSELFTENFLMPIAAAVARKTGPLPVIRLWASTAVANLVGGWVLTGVVMASMPQLAPSAVKLGQHFVKVGIGFESFASAILGGALITLMTWMEQGTNEVVGKIVAAIGTAFLLATAGLFHAIVLSVDMFAGLHAGAPYGYAEWFKLFLWASWGNILGGLGLVTALRLTQVGAKKIAHERRETEERLNGGE